MSALVVKYVLKLDLKLVQGTIQSLIDSENVSADEILGAGGKKSGKENMRLTGSDSSCRIVRSKCSLYQFKGLFELFTIILY